MEYLERVFNFVKKYYILVVPLFVMAAVPALISGTGAANTLGRMSVIFAGISDPVRMQDPTQLIKMFSAVMSSVAGTGFLAFILKFAAIPATYGMVNKALEIGKADLNDFTPLLSQNIVKYLFYWLGSIVVWIIFLLAALIIFLILGLLTAAVKALGVILLILAGIAVPLAGIVISILISLWFTAMVVDNLEVMDALKKSIALAKSNFPTILGITLLVWLAGAVAGSILGFIGLIPLIGPLVVSIVPAATSFVITVFYIMLYRNKTGKYSA